jgi:hypothetical protein
MTAMQCPKCEDSGFYRAAFGEDEAIFSCDECLEGLAKAFPDTLKSGSVLVVAIADLLRKTWTIAYAEGRKSMKEAS